MSGFTKLVPEITQSSIWNESPEVRCVWIAMIATKDKDGNLRGNRNALARLSNVPVEAVDEALRKFQAPDPDSNNPANEGRRIEAIPGGWHIVSHANYRARDYREVEAERKKEYRKKSKMSRTCPGHVPDSSVSVSASDSSSVSKMGVQGEEKKAYGEFKRVKLSDAEYDRLKLKHGAAKANKAIGILDDWLESTGKTRKNYYACLKDGSWVWGKLAASNGLGQPKADVIEINPENKPLAW